MEKYIGKSVYKGTAIGPVNVLKKSESLIKRVHVENVDEELRRLDKAKEKTLQQLARLYDKALKEVGKVNAEIFEESSPNLCVNSSFSYVVLSTLLLSSKDLTEWSLVYHSTLSYQRFYDLHSIHYDHLEGLHQLI